MHVVILTGDPDVLLRALCGRLSYISPRLIHAARVVVDLLCPRRISCASYCADDAMFEEAFARAAETSREPSQRAQQN
jgi:hypothetical protein